MTQEGKLLKIGRKEREKPEIGPKNKGEMKQI